MDCKYAKGQIIMVNRLLSIFKNLEEKDFNREFLTTYLKNNKLLLKKALKEND